jgi:hypothetical protein
LIWTSCHWKPPQIHTNGMNVHINFLPLAIETWQMCELVRWGVRAEQQQNCGNLNNQQ